MYMKSPIHNCPTPDLLGRNNKANSEDRLMGVSNAADGPSKLCLLICDMIKGDELDDGNIGFGVTVYTFVNINSKINP